MRIHALTCRRLSTLRRSHSAVLATLLVVCRLRCAGASRGRLGGLGGFRSFGGLGRLGRLSSLGGLVGCSTGSAVRSASRGAARSASRSLQSRAAAAALHGGRVLESQEARAVGDIVVISGPICVTLVE
jgi:hypothetical protein